MIEFLKKVIRQVTSQVGTKSLFGSAFVSLFGFIGYKIYKTLTNNISSQEEQRDKMRKALNNVEDAVTEVSQNLPIQNPVQNRPQQEAENKDVAKKQGKEEKKRLITNKIISHQYFNELLTKFYNNNREALIANIYAEYKKVRKSIEQDERVDKAVREVIAHEGAKEKERIIKSIEENQNFKTLCKTYFNNEKDVCLNIILDKYKAVKTDRNSEIEAVSEAIQLITEYKVKEVRASSEAQKQVKSLKEAVPVVEQSTQKVNIGNYENFDYNRIVSDRQKRVAEQNKIIDELAEQASQYRKAAPNLFSTSPVQNDTKQNAISNKKEQEASKKQESALKKQKEEETKRVAKAKEAEIANIKQQIKASPLFKEAYETCKELVSWSFMNSRKNMMIENILERYQQKINNKSYLNDKLKSTLVNEAIREEYTFWNDKFAAKIEEEKNKPKTGFEKCVDGIMDPVISTFGIDPNTGESKPSSLNRVANKVTTTVEKKVQEAGRVLNDLDNLGPVSAYNNYRNRQDGNQVVESLLKGNFGDAAKAGKSLFGRWTNQ
ncbi:MAG: hypothetical protein J0H68_03820 [Sphingobacteriia bacterium]|nr:hypothetical protein [Sphingobacteriia bacterium]